jgi:CheY-like chemotaxis protein
VVLPLAIAAVPDAAPSSPPVIPAVIAGLRGKERLRILVAEDNAFTQQLMMLTFRHYGHEAVVAGSGGEVLELWDKGAFDVILMDIRMPGMSGLEVSQEIRKEEQVRGGHIPIIALSANAFMSDREQSLAAGMDFFLAKPLSVAALLGMIHGEPPQVPVPADGDGNLPDNASGLAALFRRGDLPEILCHDGEELRTYVTLLLHDLERAIAGIETALAAGDRTGLARTVHALKGTAGHLQNRNFARLAAELERSVSATALEQVGNALDRLRKEYELLAASVTS